jgi:hypothetical protein
LPTGISHTKMEPSRSRMKRGALGGRPLRDGDRQPDWRWNRGASHDFPLLPMVNSPLAERSGCRASGPLLQLQPMIVRRRQPPRH